MKTLGLDDTLLRKYADEVFEIPPEHHQLLGYRDQSYEAEQSIDTLLLLQLVSDDHSEMQWGDVETLYFHMTRQALDAHDFRSVSAHIGE